MKFLYTRCGVNRKVLMERRDVVLNRIRYLRRIKELREAGYTNLPRRFDNTTGRTKDTFFSGELLYIKFHMFNNKQKQSIHVNIKTYDKSKKEEEINKKNLTTRLEHDPMSFKTSAVSTEL